MINLTMMFLHIMAVIFGMAGLLITIPLHIIISKMG